MGNHNKGPLSINQKIVTWVHGHLGKKVGKGECWDLAETALRHAGAQTSNDLGPVGDDTDYIWGDPINIKDVIPDDILQFRDHEVTTITEMKKASNAPSRHLRKYIIQSSAITHSSRENVK